MKFHPLLVAACLAASVAAGAAPFPSDPLLGSGGGLDHVMLWTRDADRTTSVLTDKLGLQVRPGGDFGDGIRNRLILFENHSFLELLFLDRRDRLTGDAADAFKFLAGGNGANTFALEVSDLDATAAHLRRRGFALFPETPATYDPDADGPRPARPAPFRTLFLARQALLAADLFFVSYRSRGTSGAPAPQHPNGAARLSSVWLLTSDIAADARRLSRMGFRRVRSVALPKLDARGLLFTAGRGEILLIAPDRRHGTVRTPPGGRPGRLFAIGIEVGDLSRARRIVEQGYGRSIRPYTGIWGESFEAPTRDDLGFAIEFHAARKVQQERP